jgi:hypothetical protein
MQSLIACRRMSVARMQLQTLESLIACRRMSAACKVTVDVKRGGGGSGNGTLRVEREWI